MPFSLFLFVNFKGYGWKAFHFGQWTQPRGDVLISTWLNVSVLTFYGNRDARNAGGILLQQVFRSLSSPPSCNIGCDTSTCLSAGWRPASIQPHLNTSILRRDTRPAFCAQRSRLSLLCGPLGLDDNQAEMNTNVLRGLRGPRLSVHEEELNFLSVSVIGTHPRAGWKLLFTPVHNIGPELINLPALLLGYVHDELGDGWNLVSEGGLSLTMGSMQAEQPMWENHTRHQLKDGKWSSAAAAGRDGRYAQQLPNNQPP